jgi:hypothetical protein
MASFQPTGMSDTQTVVLDTEGRFEFKGLESGVYDLGPSVREYRVKDGFVQEVLVNRDVDNASRISTVRKQKPSVALWLKHADIGN